MSIVEGPNSCTLSLPSAFRACAKEFVANVLHRTAVRIVTKGDRHAIFTATTNLAAKSLVSQRVCLYLQLMSN